MSKNLAIVLSSLTIAACGGTADQARVRVLHASPDAPAVDVLLDGGKVVSGAPFKTASSYLKVDAGSRKIEVRAAGGTADVISANVPFSKNTDTTVVAANKVASIEPLVLADDNTPPASGKVKVRVVHGAPSAPAVDVYVTAPGASLTSATPTLSNVPFKGVSAYLPVDAGSYQVRVTVAGTKTVAIDSGKVDLAAGQIRTIVAVDNSGGGSPFGAVILADLN